MLPFLDPVRATFRPEKLPGLAAWYSADYGVLSQVTNAADFVAANSEYLNIANNSTLQVGSSDFTFAFWIKPTSTVNAGVINKTSGSNLEFQISQSSASQASFFVGAAGATWLASVTTTAGVPVGSWSFIIASYTHATRLLSISVNNGTPVTATASADTVSGTNPFALGIANGYAQYANAALDEVGFWKRLLTADERAYLYNSGLGRTYSDLDAAMKVSMVSWWTLQETSGTRNDSHGTNHLTDNNTVGFTTGVYAQPATDGQTVRRWLDRSGNGRHLEQATLLNQPTFTGGNVAFDGTTSKMTASCHSSTPYSHYLACIPSRNSATWNYYVDGASNDRCPILSGYPSTDDVISPKDTSFALGKTPYLIAVGKCAEFANTPIVLGGVVNGASSRFKVGNYSQNGNAGTLHPNGALSVGVAGGGSYYGKITIMEYVMFTGALSISDEEKLTNYFSRRWGVLK